MTNSLKGKLLTKESNLCVVRNTTCDDNNR